LVYAAGKESVSEAEANEVKDYHKVELPNEQEVHEDDITVEYVD